MTSGSADRQTGLPRASMADTLRLVMTVVLPTIAKGVIIRRPRVVGLAERWGLDDRAVARMRDLRSKYGGGPLMLAIPGRSQAVILDQADVRVVLEGTPEPFAPASSEKRAALAHFEPRNSLVSHPPERTVRRRFNEDVLETSASVHSLAAAFVRIIEEEAQGLLRDLDRELDWDTFAVAWHHAVRRIVLGDKAREDHELTDMLAKLRGAANWAFLHPGRSGLRRQFHRRLAKYIERGEINSLAGRIARTPHSETTAPTDQMAQYLFAFDPGGMACFRALALLAAHPEHKARALREARSRSEDDLNMEYLRACYLEALRLWPTTPAILRETTDNTVWDGRTMPEGTHILIYAPYFHRDGETLSHAHRFTPDLWIGANSGPWPLVPFSGGPGICPARHLVPMLGAAMLASLLRGHDFALTEQEKLRPDRPLPGLLDNYSLRFRVEPRMRSPDAAAAADAS